MKQQTEGGEGEGGSQEGRNSTVTHRGGSGHKETRTERSESEMDTEGGGEANTSQLQCKHKKIHMTNIY